MPSYDCTNCPGYCCSYPVIEITAIDVARLARHFGLTDEEARLRFTKRAHGKPYVLRRKSDPHFGRICRFFDIEARRCTVYAARPGVCRKYPTTKRCGYYEFLKFERSQQDDPEWVATTDSGQWR